MRPISCVMRLHDPRRTDQIVAWGLFELVARWPRSHRRCRDHAGRPGAGPGPARVRRAPRPDPGAMRRLSPVFGLFLLAPFVGEFLLGNLTLAEPLLGLVLAPLYGCGDLVVRELNRRNGDGCATIVFLAAADKVVEGRPVGPLQADASAGCEEFLDL